MKHVLMFIFVINNLFTIYFYQIKKEIRKFFFWFLRQCWLTVHCLWIFKIVLISFFTSKCFKNALEGISMCGLTGLCPMLVTGMSGTAISLLWAGNGNEFFFPWERDKIGKENLNDFCLKYPLFWWFSLNFYIENSECSAFLLKISFHFLQREGILCFNQDGIGMAKDAHPCSPGPLGDP